MMLLHPFYGRQQVRIRADYNRPVKPIEESISNQITSNCHVRLFFLMRNPLRATTSALPWLLLEMRKHAIHARITQSFDILTMPEHHFRSAPVRVS